MPSEPASRVPSSHTPPPGLSRKQRKRWRKQRKNAALRQFGSTSLMPVKKKSWRDDQKSSHFDVTAEEQPTGSTVAKVRRISRHDEPSSHPEPSLPTGSHHAALLNHQSGSSDIRYPKTGTSVGRHLLAPSTTSFRKSSFGSKPTSVPSYSDEPDVEAAFKRFSAFLRSNRSGSSDEESDNESEDDVPSIRQFLAQEKKAKAHDFTSSDLDPPRTSPNEASNITPHENLAKSQSTEDDQLPKFSDRVMPMPTPSTTFTWPANVGIKRQNSLLDQEPGGTRSASGPFPESSTKTRQTPTSGMYSDPFLVSDNDSEDALHAMNEISTDMFGSTRPLPASKSTSSGPKTQDREDGLLTLASSDHRVTRSMTTPTRTTHLETEMQPALSGETVVCNLAHLSGDESTDRVDVISDEAPKLSEVVSRNDGKTTINSTRRRPNGASDSSSSLTELSRSPTPPQETNTNLRRRTRQRHEHIDNAEDQAASSLSNEPKPATKKRKMTGRTSKHFTPDKRKTRKQRSENSKKMDIHEDAERKETSSESERDGIQRAEKAIAVGRRPKKSKRAASGGRVSTTDENLAVDEPSPPEEKMPRAEEAIKEVITKRRQRRATESGKKTAEKETIPTAETEPEGITTKERPISSAEHEPEQIQAKGTDPPPLEQDLSAQPSAKKKRKSTGKRSSYFTPPKPVLDTTLLDRVDLYNTTSSGRKARVPAGTSTAPVPSIHEARFGIIQEKLWREPFWLLIAVTFLNKTTGRAAVPIFWELRERYPTPEALAAAPQEDLHALIHHLGLQTQRSKRLIKMSQAWIEAPPAKERRIRTLHYPCKGDGKEYKRNGIIEEDADDIAGALEIGHIPGCGPYAWDSWRIFCRDVMRGVAEDYNGMGAAAAPTTGREFVPEWKKVLPLDKELRACLRWMWLREGWIWDHDTGEKRRVTEDEMAAAVRGQMEIQDPQERKFAAQAAGVQIETPVKDAKTQEVDETPSQANVDQKSVGEQPKTPEQANGSTDASDNIVVATARKDTRRSARLST